MGTDAQISALNDMDITDIETFAAIERETVLELKTGSPEVNFSLGPEAWRGGPFRFVCPHMYWAQAAVRTCTVPPPRYDGLEESNYGEIEYNDPLTGELPVEEEEEEIAGGESGCEAPDWPPWETETRLEEDLAEDELEEELMTSVAQYTKCYEEDGFCEQEDFNVTCRANPSGRSMAAGVILQSRFFMIGGHTAAGSLEN